MKKKFIISFVTLLFLIVFIAYFLSVLSTQALYTQKNIPNNFYDEKNGYLDGVIVGASSTFTSWLPLEAWNYRGITVLNFSTPGMPASSIKYVVSEVLKYQDLKFIIINTDIIISGKMANNKLLSLHNIISALKLSKNKFLLINSLMNTYMLDFTHSIEFYFPIVRFHNRWKETRNIIHNLKIMNKLKKGSFNEQAFYKKSKHAKHHVITPYKSSHNVRIKNKSIINCMEYNNKLVINNKQYDKIVEDLFIYLSKINTNVLLINTPSRIVDNSYEHNIERYNALFKKADKYNIQHLDLNSPEIRKRLNISEKDYMDDSHLNFDGALKFTEYLSDILVRKYNLKDKKDNIEYKSWHDSYHEYSKFIFKEYGINRTNS